MDSVNLTVRLFLIASFSSTTILCKAQALQIAPSNSKESFSKFSAQSPNNQVIWSEDFSHGIPASWKNIGSDSAALWEYRGPATNPDNTIGSRGAYSGNSEPIASTTLQNGFIIFDSDYLDNFGIITSWTGPAPAPHIGTLQTEVIDLSNEPNVELVFTSYARRFAARFLIAFSTDGGQTFPDTLEYFDLDYINQMTSAKERSYENVSNIIGGKSQVVLKFIFDGTEVASNTSGYYFWMLDDISLNRVPDNALKIINRHEHLEEGITYNNSNDYAPYGIMNFNQRVPMKFHAMVLNYGNLSQSNVGIKVEVWDKKYGNLLLSLKSPTCLTLAPFDTCFQNILQTVNWVPAQAGDYSIIYKAFSDSTSGYGYLQTQVLNQYISDTLYGLDRGMVDGFEYSNHASKLAIKYNLSNANPDSAGSGKIYLKGVNIGFGPETDTTGKITISIYDTAGYPNSPGNSLYSETFSVGTLHGLNTKNFYFNNGLPVALPVANYYLEATLAPQAFEGFISIKNDASIRRVGDNSLFLAGSTWKEGSWKEENNSPWIRLIMFNAQSAPLSPKESNIQKVEVFPNPSKEFIKINFIEAGSYKLIFLDQTGRLVKKLDVYAAANQALVVNHQLPESGHYFLQIIGKTSFRTFQIIAK